MSERDDLKARQIRSAIDSILNPFAVTTPEQERLVLDAAESFADALEASAPVPPAPTVTTKAELDALWLDAVVVDASGIPRMKRARTSHMPAGWTHGGSTPLTSGELADGRPMTVIYEGRDLRTRQGRPVPTAESETGA